MSTSVSTEPTHSERTLFAMLHVFNKALKRHAKAYEACKRPLEVILVAFHKPLDERSLSNLFKS